ncbi:hypothetical protein BC835DRAFT_1302611 [Cytidiella melzeri]|nr:hypothetical protein BC835DRAFT_1302611 [Cytidiella melzeri]
MEIPQHLFLVPALNTFHSGTKVRPDARRHFDILNQTKPKLQGLLGVLKASKASTKQESKPKPKPLLPTAVRRVSRPSMAKKCVASGIVDGLTPVIVAPVKKVQTNARLTNVTTRQAVTRQTATPPPESKPLSRQPPRARATPPAPVNRPTTSTTASVTKLAVSQAKASTERHSVSPVSLRRRQSQQLPTPPPTPPLDAPLVKAATGKSSTQSHAKIPRSAGMLFSKPTPIPRSKPMVFRPESTLAPKSAVAKITRQVTVTVPRATAKPATPFQKEECKAPTSPLASKLQFKAMQSSQAGKFIGPSNNVRTPATKAQLLKPVTPKSETPAKAVAAKTPTSTAKATEIKTLLLAVKSSDPAPVQVASAVANCEKELESATAEIIAAAVAQTCKTSEAKNASKETALSKPCEALRPLEASHCPAVTELKTVLTIRSISITAEPTMEKFHRKQEPQDPSIKTAPTPTGHTVNFTGSTIQARIAAMYASSRVNPPAQPTVIPVGARVRQFKTPELLDTDKASRNERIQREVEALRNMNKVGTGSAAIVKTRAFGGSETANAGVQESQVRALPLHLKSIVERVRQERTAGSAQQN